MSATNYVKVTVIEHFTMDHTTSGSFIFWPFHMSFALIDRLFTNEAVSRIELVF